MHESLAHVFSMLHIVDELIKQQPVYRHYAYHIQMLTSGPLLVSITGAAGWAKLTVKASNDEAIATIKYAAEVKICKGAT